MNPRLRAVLTDIFEVFHPNDGVLELFGEDDETTVSNLFAPRIDAYFRIFEFSHLLASARLSRGAV